VTSKSGEKVDKHRLTQVGRALKDWEGADDPRRIHTQARVAANAKTSALGQGRLPQELRLAGITTIEDANEFLRQRYIAVFNQKSR